jgi:hypothetical protein
MSARHVLLLTGLLVALPTVGGAGTKDAAVQAELDADAGWRVHKIDGRGGVDIYKKKIEALGLLAFKGVKIIDVGSGPVFDAILDFEGQVGLSEDIPLVASVVLGSGEGYIDFAQYLDTPGWTGASDRYWFARAHFQRDIDGAKGHHKQAWEGIDATPYPDVLAAFMKRSSRAILTPSNYGSWELIPQSDGRTKMIYRVVSDPGGRLLKAAQSLATGTTLPDNLLQFEAEGRRRAGK